MIDGQPCGKTKCLKETNPNAENPKFRGQFLGKPYIYEECWHSCYLCNLNLKEEGEDDSIPNSQTQVEMATEI